MNTKFTFTYRDASNYKAHNECILAGEIDTEQIGLILDACESGENFIPHQVGLEGKTLVDEGYVYSEDLDHPWFELGEHSFELTAAEPTVEMTVAQLVANFVVHKGHWEDDVDEETVNTDLYDKLFKEQEQFKGWLLQQPPENILDRAYEYCVRENIICFFENGSCLNINQAAALLIQPCAMDVLYHEWGKIDTSEMEQIWECIESFATDKSKQWQFNPSK